MQNSEIGISIVLPTLNEKENLKFLIPNLEEVLINLSINNYEIIVVDDNSTDGTDKFVSTLNSKNNNIRIITRKSEKSLPMSIYTGIKSSNFSHVMWLDADG